MSNTSNQLQNTYDTEALLKQYQPLVKTIYKKYHTYFSGCDKTELYTQIEYEFVKLVQEYDPRRGVDFPCYIKRMLNLRVYHFITKTSNVHQHEVECNEVFDSVDAQHSLNLDEDINMLLVEGLSSLDENLTLGKKQRNLMIDILLNKKPLAVIANEEGTDIKVIRLRLHFLCKKLWENSKLMEEYTDWINGRTPRECIDFTE